MREITGSIEQKDKGTSSDIESWEDALSRPMARKIFDKISFPYSLFRAQCNCVFYFNLIIIQGSRKYIMDFFAGFVYMPALLLIMSLFFQKLVLDPLYSFTKTLS